MKVNARVNDATSEKTHSKLNQISLYIQRGIITQMYDSFRAL